MILKWWELHISYEDDWSLGRLSDVPLDAQDGGLFWVDTVFRLSSLSLWRTYIAIHLFPSCFERQ